MKLLLCAIAGYLLGSISVSILVTKYIFHDDLRQQGSGNAGATNAARVYGLGAGVLTFAGDFAKSILAMLLGRGLGGVMGLAVGGAACLLGHCFPVYFKFKGGKAVSAGAAVGLMIDWRLFVLLVAVFALMALLSKRASVCSMTAAIVLAAGTTVFHEGANAHRPRCVHGPARACDAPGEHPPPAARRRAAVPSRLQQKVKDVPVSDRNRDNFFCCTSFPFVGADDAAYPK